MRNLVDAAALGLGYLTLASLAVLAVAGLWARYKPRPAPAEPPKPRGYVLAVWPPSISPHPLAADHPVLYVEAPDPASAWAALGEAA